MNTSIVHCIIYCYYKSKVLFQEDGWDTDPFVLTEVDGKLYGRGATDDKVNYSL